MAELDPKWISMGEAAQVAGRTRREIRVLAARMAACGLPVLRDDLSNVRALDREKFAACPSTWLEMAAARPTDRRARPPQDVAFQSDWMTFSEVAQCAGRTVPEIQALAFRLRAVGLPVHTNEAGAIRYFQRSAFMVSPAGWIRAAEDLASRAEREAAKRAEQAAAEVASALEPQVAPEADDVAVSGGGRLLMREMAYLARFVVPPSGGAFETRRREAMARVDKAARRSDLTDAEVVTMAHLGVLWREMEGRTFADFDLRIPPADGLPLRVTPNPALSMCGSSAAMAAAL